MAKQVLGGTEYKQCLLSLIKRCRMRSVTPSTKWSIENWEVLAIFFFRLLLNDPRERLPVINLRRCCLEKGNRELKIVVFMNWRCRRMQSFSSSSSYTGSVCRFKSCLVFRQWYNGRYPGLPRGNCCRQVKYLKPNYWSEDFSQHLFVHFGFAFRSVLCM